MREFTKRILIFVAAISLILFSIDMYNSTKEVWFEGSNEINSDIKKIEIALINAGESFEKIVSRVSGITSAILIEQGNDFVEIKTNEGLMKRTNIIKSIESDKIFLNLTKNIRRERQCSPTLIFVMNT